MIKNYNRYLAALLFAFSSSAFACIVRPQQIGDTAIKATADSVSYEAGTSQRPERKTIKEDQVIVDGDQKYSVTFIKDELRPDGNATAPSYDFLGVVITQLKTGESVTITKIKDNNGPVFRALGGQEVPESKLSFRAAYRQKTCSVEKIR